ncbi:C40 family peptidase [Kitasatospora sp. NPDC092286]|uniref:C40 family peptidase n=1 Tax=Kitasatospora sp. NPDC092286 TaxID=3364087 RepID=UPI003809C1D8
MTTVNTGAPGITGDPTGQPVATNDQRAAARSARTSRAARVRRGMASVAVIAAGAGVLGLGTGVGSAAADPAPAHAGWDGSRYWFKNSQGQWRWTTHADVYQARTGGSGSGSGGSSSGATTAGSSSGGITQGWDGSRYWFKNSQGQWRWTTHADVYQARTGGGGSSSGSTGPADSAPAPSGAPTTSAPAANGDVEAAVQYALAQVGKPFRTGGNGPDGYDCSGLVQQAFRHGGISLPRVANDQYAATTPVRAGQLQRGDLLYWSDDGSARGIHHTAIYLGDNQYVEAARPGTKVRVSRISSGYYPTHMGRP